MRLPRAGGVENLIPRARFYMEKPYVPPLLVQIVLKRGDYII